MRSLKMIHRVAGLVLTAVLPLLATPAAAKNYKQENLVSDLSTVGATVVDANLLNPWGIVNPPGGPLWVSDNNAGVATLYNGVGTPFPLPPSAPLIVTIPTPLKGTPPAAPTGIVWGPRGFVVSSGGKSGAAAFIFATEDGTISGWNPTVDATHAILAVDNSVLDDPSKNAVYKGLALGTRSTLSNKLGLYLYATNFHDGVVEEYDSTFTFVTSFTDKTLPSGFAPFGIRNINGNLYVTFALQNTAKHDDVAGKGHGFVDVFDTDGKMLRRFASKGKLNSPWGLALAPADFGKFSNKLLIGNFGDGRINAYDLATGNFAGTLDDQQGKPLSNDGLWALDFGDTVLAANPNELFFTAGINNEKDGLFGKIVAVP
jgi:uncharacterized protein (TIGR03118 family)